MAKLCSVCGKELTPNARFCASCGAVVSESPVEVTGTIHSLGTTTDSGPLTAVEPPELTKVAPGAYELLIVRGPAAGSRIELVGAEMSVGRSPDAAIFLDDITVSRLHAKFERADTGWKLVDLGSLNGSYVNRERIDSVSLTRGDQIQIGKYRFHYLAGDSGAGSSSAGNSSAGNSNDGNETDEV